MGFFNSTVLYKAIQKDDIDTVKLLLENPKIDVNIKAILNHVFIFLSNYKFILFSYRSKSIFFFKDEETWILTHLFMVILKFLFRYLNKISNSFGFIMFQIFVLMKFLYVFLMKHHYILP